MMTRIWFLELGCLCWVRFAQLDLGESWVRLGASWSLDCCSLCSGWLHDARQKTHSTEEAVNIVEMMSVLLPFLSFAGLARCAGRNDM